MTSRLKNRIAKIEVEKGLGSQPIIVVINFGSDCKEDWAKAEADAIGEYKENNGEIDIRDARFVRLGFR